MNEAKIENITRGILYWSLVGIVAAPFIFIVNSFIDRL